MRGDDEQGGVPHANFRNEVLVVNLTMAKALDLTLPPLILSQADEVIE